MRRPLRGPLPPAQLLRPPSFTLPTLDYLSLADHYCDSQLDSTFSLQEAAARLSLAIGHLKDHVSPDNFLQKGVHFF
jgi:hypothetical protein